MKDQLDTKIENPRLKVLPGIEIEYAENQPIRGHLLATAGVVAILASIAIWEANQKKAPLAPENQPQPTLNKKQ